MTGAVNRRVVLARHAKGDLAPGIFRIEDVPVDEPGPGQILVRNHFASLEPGLAGAITGEAYLIAPMQIGAPVRATTVGTVVQSRSPLFAAGDAVQIQGSWQDYAVVDADPPVVAQLRPCKLDLQVAAAEQWLAMLGLSAFTAYLGIERIARTQPGETVVISAAAGGVGGMAGQYARLAGARVIGIAGGREKCAYVTDTLRFDAAIDYKSEPLPERLDRLCPDGIDVYFENVGGAVLDAVWPRLANFARVPLCGQVSQYGMAERPAGPNLFEATIKRLQLTGFMSLDARHADDFAAFQARTSAAIQAGEIDLRIDIADGLDNAESAWLGLLGGDNIGKRLLRISEPPRG